MTREEIYDVYWQGPFEWRRRNELNNPGHVLYSLHGTHHLYGQNVLLYIGMTENTPKGRFLSHEKWVVEEYDPMTIKVASVGKFINWKVWDEFEEDEPYPKFEDYNILNAIESLLIYSSQPAYNIVNKESLNNAQGIRIFNTGHAGLLFPEVSYKYFIGEKSI